MDYLLEVVTVPVRDVDRSLAFYTEQVGFTLDAAGGFEPGVDPEHGDYASFAELTDPDGNTWTLQERHHAAGGSV